MNPLSSPCSTSSSIQPSTPEAHSSNLSPISSISASGRDAINQKIINLVREFNELNMENKRLNKKYCDLEQEKENYRSKNEKLENKYKTLKIVNDKYKTQNAQLSQECTTINTLYHLLLSSPVTNRFKKEHETSGGDLLLHFSNKISTLCNRIELEEIGNKELSLSSQQEKLNIYINTFNEIKKEIIESLLMDTLIDMNTRNEKEPIRDIDRNVYIDKFNFMLKNFRKMGKLLQSLTVKLYPHDPRLQALTRFYYWGSAEPQVIYLAPGDTEKEIFEASSSITERLIRWSFQEVDTPENLIKKKENSNHSFSQPL
ncbi:hypothetical protein [Neochlamydia sp. AcF84]|uniref:hypothetical protein n=1 Tax=Neochlamydia sp. AcF84 TaxID=2315858 RepID=UPI00140C4E59|nr:hypothetical protein [Neochlamydia sp. AcF84]